MGHREQLGSLLREPLPRERSLEFCNAAGNIQGRDRGMAWMSQLSRFSPKLRKKRTQRALDTFSSGWEKWTHGRLMVPTDHVSPTCQGPFNQTTSFICFLNLCLDVVWSYMSHLGKRFLENSHSPKSVCNIWIVLQYLHWLPGLSLLRTSCPQLISGSFSEGHQLFDDDVTWNPDSPWKLFS